MKQIMDLKNEAISELTEDPSKKLTKLNKQIKNINDQFSKELACMERNQINSED